MYNTIIFDVDGTLIDTEKAVLSSLQKVLKTDYGRAVPLEELYFVLGIPGTDSLPQLGIKDVNRANERWNCFMKDFFHSIEVFNGIKDLLETIKTRNIVQGIVTSKTNEELINDFVPFGLSNYLIHTVCADDTVRHKPHPEPLLKFLEISGADPKKSIYIGDTIYDYECARDAGIDFGLALWGCKNHEDIQAKYKFERPQDLLDFLD
ncbi:HAD family hydrolase [Cytobacillus praedii]|uniref:HAD family hydrolase n=1 Tax=Cytobacillus praedii TaxID=1742358 RepID=UPI002E1CCF14|nr:HAD family hydrolase [Cytobacillus praedii]